MAAQATGSGVPFDLWGQRGWAHRDVVGESNYAKEIRSAFGRQFDPAGTELYLTAQLVPEPHNKHDRNAVSVRIDGSTVGHLPREEAARYAPVLSELVAQGWLPQVGARVWGGQRTSYDYDRRGRTIETTEFVGSVRLDLAEPHLLTPTNQPPAETYALLPRGNAIQVTGEEDDLARLVPLLSPSGAGWIYRRAPGPRPARVRLSWPGRAGSAIREATGPDVEIGGPYIERTCHPVPSQAGHAGNLCAGHPSSTTPGLPR